MEEGEGGRHPRAGWGASPLPPLVWGQCPEGHMDSASLGWGLEGSPRLLETGTESAGMEGLFSVGASHGCSAYSSGREFGVLNSVVQDNGNKGSHLLNTFHMLLF